MNDPIETKKAIIAQAIQDLNADMTAIPVRKSLDVTLPVYDTGDDRLHEVDTATIMAHQSGIIAQIQRDLRLLEQHTVTVSRKIENGALVEIETNGDGTNLYYILSCCSGREIITEKSKVTATIVLPGAPIIEAARSRRIGVRFKVNNLYHRVVNVY
ncbi:MAG: hypothetical protein WC495_00415 [Patescibacteria group bacterium]